MKEILKDQSENAPFLLWLGIALTSLLIVLAFLVFGVWSWGLMEDHNSLTLPGKNILERVWFVSQEMVSGDRFRPVYDLYKAIFYKIFEFNPKAFYVFRWFEIVLTLLPWGLLASQMTRHKIAFPLFVCVCLSFSKFYDAYFHLSVQEVMGLFFAGWAGLFLFKAFAESIAEGEKTRRGFAFLGIVLLLITFFSKESYLVVGIAWAIGLIVSGFFGQRSKILLIYGAAILILSLGYGAWLKLSSTGGYSSGYSFSDVGKISNNAWLWVRHDLLAHAPWIFLIIVMIFQRISLFPLNPVHRFGLVLSGSLYMGCVLILLPWSTIGHYAIPLGLFFAFFISILAASGLEKLKPKIFLTVTVLSLVFSIMVGVAVMKDGADYQKDSSHLIKWLANNTQFVYEVSSGANVGSNAMEPGVMLPILVKYFYNTPLSEFVFTPKVKDLIVDRKIKYYLYGSAWGDQDLSRLGKMWYPVFVSKNWIVFRRLY